MSVLPPTGISTDSLFPGHPGLPQDHARWSRNKIYSNNVNYFKRYVDKGVCAKPMPQRGYIDGTVCPVARGTLDSFPPGDLRVNGLPFS